MTETDLIYIPLAQFQKVVDIRYNLKESLSKSIEKKDSEEIFQLNDRKNMKLRSKTVMSKFSRRHKTEFDLPTENNTEVYSRTAKRKNTEMIEDSSVKKMGKSLSEIQWSKFIKRK